MKPLIIETGWYHPSNANWSYHIFMVIDDTGARLYKSTFGSENCMKVDREKLHAGKGSAVHYKWADIKDLKYIENYTGKNWGEGSLN